ncbi:MAG: hypothetical protein JPMHGGIA_00578 [Saprospiraceae bacterium]|jgi:uncharacterized protein (TIGR02246 family)|nr:hypothetical protein [Saprospiraceae bacterium]
MRELSTRIRFQTIVRYSNQPALLAAMCWLFGFVACGPDPVAVRREVFDTERAFERRVAGNGMAEAFAHFAADSAVILRGGRLIKGRQAIRAFYDQRVFGNVSLKWEPTHISVSQSGDLAYTYGRYTFTSTDTAGRVHPDTGVFHTVWQRQPDGAWRYVWD